MDNVPFTLFFMVCLLSFQGNVIGKPATDVDMKAIPKRCEEQFRTQNFCNEKPEDYPSDDELRQLYKRDIGKIDIQYPQTNETGNRVDENRICPEKPYLADHVYLIRTENKEIRYAFYLPGVYEMNVPVVKCNSDATKNLQTNYRKRNIKCVQKSFQYSYIVLSKDMKSLEPAKILGIESSCDLVHYK